MINKGALKQAGLRAATCISFSIVCAGCGSGFNTPSATYYVADGGFSVTPPPSSGSDSSSGHSPASDAQPAVGFCSYLNFDHVTWNSMLTSHAQRNLAVALSVTGEFEGHAGWQNIAIDFDGQGLSAGLLNQNLGTGSLQPLLAAYQTSHPAEFAAFFSPAHAASITAMLNAWKSATQWKPNVLGRRSLAAVDSIDPDDFVDPTGVIREDLLGRPTTDSRMAARASGANLAAVLWARNTLYQSDKSFVPQWKQELQLLLKSPNYVSLQVNAAMKIHARALIYVQRTAIYDLRNYLLMFDIITQNGGITEARFKEWDEKMRSQELVDDTAKLKALLEIRLQDTSPEWKADTRSRKLAIITGAGVVHGKNLDLPKMFCYQSSDPL